SSLFIPDEIPVSIRFHYTLFIMSVRKVSEEAIFYAGYVYQRSDSLEVIRLSGRYPQKYSAAQEALLESYLAQKFCEAYGTQKVIFYSFNEALSLSGILSDNREYWDKNKHRIMRREYNEVLQTAINNITITGSFHAKDWLKIKDNVQLQTAINHTAAINHFSRDLWRHIRSATALQKAINNVAAIDKFSQSHWLTIKDNPKLQTAINHIAATGSFYLDDWNKIIDAPQLQTAVNNIAAIESFSRGYWDKIKNKPQLQAAINHISATGHLSRDDWYKIRNSEALQIAVNHIATTSRFSRDNWNKIKSDTQFQTAAGRAPHEIKDETKDNSQQLQTAIHHITTAGISSHDDWYTVQNSKTLQQAVNNIAATGHFLYDDWRKIKSDFLLQQAINTIAATEHFSRDDWCKITTTEQTSIRNKFQEKIISLKELTINKTENRQTAIDSYAVKAFTCFTSKVLDKTNRETFKETLHSVQKECTQILDDSLSRKILKVITNFLSHISLVGMIANSPYALT
ncbi:hypothetical protein, partial [Piscirickettsia salmonis]